MNMQENTGSQEKKEVKKVKGSYFEVPGVPISEINEETVKKKAQESFFEVSGSPKSGFTGESGMKSEEKVEEKKTSVESTPFEIKEPSAKEFTAPGEIETGYTEKSWEKPEKSMTEKTAEITEEIRPVIEEETIESKDIEAKERETREREAREAREKEEKEAREAKEKEDKEAREAREKEEKEAREREKREEKRTVYSMEKHLTKSKTDRKLFGVCGGLGEYFGIDPTLIRLAFILLGLLHGIGLILYIILAIIMPSEKSVEMVPSSRK